MPEFPQSRSNRDRQPPATPSAQGKRDVIYICTRHPLAFSAIKQAILGEGGLPSVLKLCGAAAPVGEMNAGDFVLVDTCSVEHWSEIMQDCQQMNARILLLVRSEEQDRLKCLHALRHGGHGIVTMSPDLGSQLPKAIRAVTEGHLWISRGALEDYVKQTNPLLRQISVTGDFTAREEQIMGLMRQGLQNRQIGNLLGISERTVKFHVSNILKKSQIESRRELLPKLEPRPVLMQRAAGSQ